MGTGADLREAVDDALCIGGIDQTLRTSLGDPRDDAGIVVKAALPPGSAHEEPPLTYADPTVVETLVARLRKLGWGNVQIVVPGPGGAATAAAVGYRLEVCDLTGDVTTFDYGPLLGEREVAQMWKEADARIVVGKARNDPQLLYVGGLIATLSSLPHSGEPARRLTAAHDISACALDVLERLPVAFGVLDAWRTHETKGYPRPGGRIAETGAVLASGDLLALDWMLGELMDLDGPELNPVVSEALQRRSPLDLDRRGDLTPWQSWHVPRPLRAALCDIGSGHRWGRLLGWEEVPWTAR